MQNVRDLPRRVHCDVDPATFQKADMRAVKIAGFSKALLGEPVLGPDLSNPRAQALLEIFR